MGGQKEVSKNYRSPSDLKIKHRYLLESLAWERQGCLVSYIDMDWVVVAWHHNNFYQDTYL